MFFSLSILYLKINNNNKTPTILVKPNSLLSFCLHSAKHDWRVIKSCCLIVENKTKLKWTLVHLSDQSMLGWLIDSPAFLWL